MGIQDSNWKSTDPDFGFLGQAATNQNTCVGNAWIC
jgi:hypothetical protein